MSSNCPIFGKAKLVYRERLVCLALVEKHQSEFPLTRANESLIAKNMQPLLLNATK